MIWDHPQQITMDGSTRQQKLYNESIELLKIAEPPEGYYLATSFGKDSIVAQRLCDEAGVKYDAHHNITGIDPPELVYFGRNHYPDVERHMYSASMWALIRKKGIPPMRHMRYCCDVLKEGRGIGRTCVMGMRAAESSRRAKQWGLAAPMRKNSKKGDPLIRMLDNDEVRDNIQACQTAGQLVISPLFRWNDNDLWAYIADRKLPYCELYDKGFDRLGCIGCPLAGENRRRAELDRWPGFRKIYTKVFQGLKDAGRFARFSTGEDILEWWLSDGEQNKVVDGQIDMFDTAQAGKERKDG